MILLTALMSPRDEDELISHLRRLGAAEHLQTHHSAALDARAAEPSPKGGLLGKFRKRSKETAEPMGGCDPEVFAGEIRTFLRAPRSSRRKRSPAAVTRRRLPPASTPARRTKERRTSPPFVRDYGSHEPLPSVSDHHAGPAEGSNDSTWSSPFEWKSNYSAKGVHARFSQDNSAAEAERRASSPRRPRRSAWMVALEEEAARAREDRGAAPRGRGTGAGPAPGSRGARGAAAPRSGCPSASRPNGCASKRRKRQSGCCTSRCAARRPRRRRRRSSASAWKTCAGFAPRRRQRPSGPASTSAP